MYQLCFNMTSFNMTSLFHRNELIKHRFRANPRCSATPPPPPTFPEAKNVPLVFSSSGKFNTYQPKELQLFNIFSLMEVRSSPLGSIMEIFTNTRQAPWFTRWMNRLKSSHSTRLCKLEVRMALNTFLSLINIS